jgi:hypothetical protein
MLTIDEAAKLMHCPVWEILAVDESPAGDLITTFDGNTMVLVPEDRPDFDGKTGLMFLVAPVPPEGRPYVGGFPVYTNPPADDMPVVAPAADAGERDLGVPTKDELLARARELGIDADGRWGEKRLIEAITAALEAQEAERAALVAEADELEIEGIDAMDTDELVAAIAAAREQL